jgi:hypothetical protein
MSVLSWLLFVAPVSASQCWIVQSYTADTLLLGCADGHYAARRIGDRMLYTADTLETRGWTLLDAQPVGDDGLTTLSLTADGQHWRTVWESDGTWLQIRVAPVAVAAEVGVVVPSPR